MKSEDLTLIILIAAAVNFTIMYFLIREAVGTVKRNQILIVQAKMLALIAKHVGASEDEINVIMGKKSIEVKK